MKIAVVGLGYVGLSLAVLLAQRDEVVALDVNTARVDQVNAGMSPIEDASGRGTAPFVSTVLVPSESRVTVVPGPAGAGASVPGSFSGTVMVVWAFAAIPRDRAATAVSVTFLRDIRASPYSAGVVRRS